MKRDHPTKKNRLLFTELNGSAKQHLFLLTFAPLRIPIGHPRSCQTDQLSPRLMYVWLARADRV